ncbi:hypothetical protein [Mesorhizobium wenxiniae]|nr:hypothetical protein [Mesorhizobium wenxiniae]
MSVDLHVRRALARLRLRFVTESATRRWPARRRGSFRCSPGRNKKLKADTFVYSATSAAGDEVSRKPVKRGIVFTALGDCTAARAAFAIHNVRKVALGL